MSSCPELSALARVGTPHADPEVVEHVKNCDACRLDWQIQQGARYLLDPEINTSASASLNERIIARATAIIRHSEQLPGWGHLVGSGLLAALATFAVALAQPNAGLTVSATQAGVYALLVIVATATYLRHVDLAECADY
ncbi:MAG: hypothetical protein F4Z31_14145 [Gemmatimonadetes bacterium]|nr:hypothetical protein [Gemmatimonadota bacterium]MCY3676750.1 hypothetical protein [Gemmatimonadota bacterium]MYA42878.1 hypothetical protein [Gemmatimonadota bacterium]MYE93932.1 hypothetical protein [Gemmatimonadota bacterium]MYJ09429.1 hypothetical protein [Gemmatimonadota bacterium]